MSATLGDPPLDPAADGSPLAGLIEPTRRGRSAQMIGDVIVELGFARRDVVDAAVASAREQGRTTGQLLVDAGELRHDQLARALAERLGLDYLDLAVFHVDYEAMTLIDVDLARRYESVPVGFMPDGSLILAMADPTNVLTLDEMTMITGHRIHPAVAPRQDLRGLIARYPGIDSVGEEPGEAKPEPIALQLAASAAPDAPAVKLVRQIISNAVQRGASDIHLDPEDGELVVQLRVDGVLTSGNRVPRSMAASVVSRIKIMGGLNIAERRVPQDGRAAVTIDGRSVDLRVATLPLVGGEGVVLRILDTNAVVRELSSLGMQEDDRLRFEAALAKPYGAVLVTGPTGSGKSTTLYGGLTVINDGERSIITIEDPVESPVRGIKQMQVAVKAGLTFATGLRSVLRADPDVIMVGEIRDRETAEIAIQSALTGHLMLSTLHTRDAPSAISRLGDMGVEPFMIAAALDCVVAQRLARKLCTSCRRESSLPRDVLAGYGLQDAEVYDAGGCGRCGGTGYTGRIGLYEVMPMTEELRTLVLAGAGVDALHSAAVRAGMRTMYQDGLDKVGRGLTSLVELSRVTTSMGQAAEGG